MTGEVYLDKTGAELATGYTVVGADPTGGFRTWNATAPIGWKTKFLGHASYSKYLYYTWGSHLNWNTNSFWIRATIQTPSSFSGSHRAEFGVYDSLGIGNVSYFVDDPAWNPTPHAVNSGLACFSMVMSVSTTYHLIFIHDAVAKTFSCSIATTDDVILETKTVSTTNFSNGIDSFGFSKGVGVSSYSDWWILSAIKCTSGTQEFIYKTGKSNQITAELLVKPPGDTAWTDLTDYIESIKIHKRFNAATETTIRLMNPKDIIRNKIIPNTKVKIRVGYDRLPQRVIFWGYLPPHPDFCDKVSISGKDYTYSHESLISLYGVNQKVIKPASAENPDVKETSEGEDLYKALKYIALNSDPRVVYKTTDTSLEFVCYDFIAKLTQELAFYDEADNLDGMLAHAAIFKVVKSLHAEDVT